MKHCSRELPSLFCFNLLPLEQSPLPKGAEHEKEFNRGNGEEEDGEE